VLVRAEGTERIVVEVKATEVIWRFAGGDYRRTVTLHGWRTDTVSASVVDSRGSRNPR
jgi:hypothetical protein